MDGIEQFFDDGLVGWDTQALEFAPSSVLVVCLIGGWVVAQALEFAPTFFHLLRPIGWCGAQDLGFAPSSSHPSLPCLEICSMTTLILGGGHC